MASAPDFDAILERTQSDFFWVPPDVRVVDRPEIAYLSADRDAPYVNVVKRTRAADSRIPALVDEVVEAHRGRRSRWLVFPSCRTPVLDAALAAAGYFPSGEFYAAVRSVAAPQPGRAREWRVHQVDSIERMRDWVDVVVRSFPESVRPPDSELEFDLTLCTGPAPRLYRSVAYAEDGRAVAAGGIMIFPESSFGYLWAGSTVPDARQRGAYSALLYDRIDYARARGLAHVGLYAGVDSSLPIVERHGFERHGCSTFWRSPRL
jgi:hypothetical protein